MNYCIQSFGPVAAGDGPAIHHQCCQSKEEGSGATPDSGPSPHLASHAVSSASSDFM